MIERLDQSIDGLEEWIKYVIPQSEFKSEKVTFYNPDLGSGQIVKILTKILRENGHSDENISKRIFASTNDKLTFLYFQSNSNDALGKFFFEKNEKIVKSDWIISTPKFGKSNETLNLLQSWMKYSNKGCAVMFGTKSVLDKKSNSDRELKEFLNNYLSKFIFINPIIFGTEKQQTPLGFYLFEKNKNENKIVVLNSLTGQEHIYNNIYYINEFGNSDIFVNIRKKYIEYCKNVGSLKDITYSKDTIKKNLKRYKLSLPCQRGHIQQNKTNSSFFSNDFYSFLSFDGKIHGDISTTLPDVKRMNIISSSNKIELENIRNYTTQYFARFGLTFGKFDTTQIPSTFRFVPLFDFNKSVTELKFKNALGLTNQEMKWIEKVMKPYM